jgi:spore maturation protein CgeB
VRHHTNKQTLKNAFAKVGITWEIDYVSHGANIAQVLEDSAKAFQPHLIFMQVHRADVINGAVIRAMRKVAPHTVIANWIGDVYDFLSLDPKQAQAWKELDALLLINANSIDQLAQVGITAFHFAHSFEKVDGALPPMPVHDVVFLGNAYSDTRKQMGKLLKAMPYSVGIYGHGYTITPDGETHYDFAKGHALYKNAKIAVSDQQFDALAYTSNRFWEIASSGGALILHQYTKGFESLGLVDGEHYIAWHDLSDLREKINFWMKPENDNKRKAIVRRVKRVVDAEHSFDARVKYLLTDVIPQLMVKTTDDTLVTA